MFSLAPYRLPEPVPTGRGMRVAVSPDLGFLRRERGGGFGAVRRCGRSGRGGESSASQWSSAGPDEACSTALTHLNFVSRSVLASALPEGSSDQLTLLHPRLARGHARGDGGAVVAELGVRRPHVRRDAAQGVRRRLRRAGVPDDDEGPTSRPTSDGADDADPAELREQTRLLHDLPVQHPGPAPGDERARRAGRLDRGADRHADRGGRSTPIWSPYRVAATLEAERGCFFDTHRPALGAP